jgi:hypothetical protein
MAVHSFPNGLVRSAALIVASSAHDPAHQTPFDYNGNLLRSKAGIEPNSAHKLALARANINKMHIPPRQPLIHLAQQQQQQQQQETEPMYEEYDEYEDEEGDSYDSFAQPLLEPNRLSTITEKTEMRTVDSRSQFGFSPSEYAVDTTRQHLAAPVRTSVRPMSTMTVFTSSTVDYGQPICTYDPYATVSRV